MELLVFLDRQHSGKPHSVRDRGAWGDLDQNGRPDVEESEAFLTGQYLWHAERKLIELGHSVLPISDGRYSERHARVTQYAAASQATKFAYIAAHVNAGGGTYASCFCDARSQQGPLLASAILDRLRPFPEITAIKLVAANQDTYANALATISGVYKSRAVGICYEPAFIDAPTHRPLFTKEGLCRLGEALALGIDTWARQP